VNEQTPFYHRKFPRNRQSGLPGMHSLSPRAPRVIAFREHLRQRRQRTHFLWSPPVDRTGLSGGRTSPVRLPPVWDQEMHVVQAGRRDWPRRRKRKKTTAIDSPANTQAALRPGKDCAENERRWFQIVFIGNASSYVTVRNGGGREIFLQRIAPRKRVLCGPLGAWGGKGGGKKKKPGGLFFFFSFLGRRNLTSIGGRRAVAEGMAEALDVDFVFGFDMTRGALGAGVAQGRHGHCRRGQIGLRLRRGRLPGAFPEGGF